MSNFVIERSPKREGINKGDALAYQYDQLARNPLGDSQVHHEIKTEMAHEGMKKSPRIDSGLRFLDKEQGCLTIHQSEWDRFIALFPTDQGSAEVGKIALISI